MFNERRAARRQDEGENSRNKEVERNTPSGPSSRNGFDIPHRPQQQYTRTQYQSHPNSSSGNRYNPNKRHHTDNRQSYGQREQYNGQQNRKGIQGNRYDKGSYRVNNYHSNDRNTGKNGRNERTPVVPLESLRLPNSGWDKCPKKLDGISAKVVKSFGVFTEAGVSLLDTLTDKNIERLINQQKILEKQKRLKLNQQRIIGLNESKVSKRVVLRGVDFAKSTPQSICKVLESFLASTVIPNVSYEEVGLTAKVENNILIIECSSSLVATTIMSFNGKHIEDLDVTLSIERPGDYIEYRKSFEDDNTLKESEEGNDIIEEIVETSALCCANNIPTDLANSKFKETLQKYGVLHSAVLLLDKLTYDCCDVAFFSFKNSDSKPIENILKEISENEKWNCFQVCKNPQNDYFQTVDFVRNMLVDYIDSKFPNISRHKVTSTIQIINSISLDDAMDESKAKEVANIFEHELSQLEGFEKLQLVTPEKEFKVYQIEEIQPEYCRIYVKFQSPKNAKACLNNICGRYFHGRLIFGGYVDDEDYKQIFQK